MLDNQMRFVIDNYAKKSTFASFLPGISGETGIPIWSFYVNRGQAISSFGIQDKDHSIMQFTPAHQAYQNTKRVGFRTFIKINDKVIEAFLNEDNPHSMYIGMNELEIVEKDSKNKIEVKVRYFTLPGERVAGLVRCFSIKNLGNEDINVEIVDGMPAIIPYGINLAYMNEMGQTAKAWMQVENIDEKLPIFKVRASLEDSARVDEIKGSNFGFAISNDGNQLPVIVNNKNIFGYDTSLMTPHNFIHNSIKDIIQQEQITENDVPCCFFLKNSVLKPEDSMTLYEIYGQTEELELVNHLKKKAKSGVYFENKRKEAIYLTDKLTKKILTKTGNQVFDQYCKQTYLDNVLRGGEPIILGSNKVFYLYSRKHGDIERDYNYFRMLPEFYSQGNGNFRDVNQNRRCDVLFSPYVKKQNIKLFYNAIQIDGYNPLGIEKITYYLKESIAKEYEGLEDFLIQSFTPGELYKKLIDCKKEELFFEIINKAEEELKTDFIEGYWTDHWTYNLDLIEKYLMVYPEDEENLLFRDNSYTFTIGREVVLPARKRYVETVKGIRQYHFLEKNLSSEVNELLKNKNGEIVTCTLIEKLILLTILKFASLDMYGMGIEMEGGKPGWYDALNGLPGLLGSSMAETYELERQLEYIIKLFEKRERGILLVKELNDFLNQIVNINDKYDKQIENENCLLDYWKEINYYKENYRANVEREISGIKEEVFTQELIEKLRRISKTINIGIKKALEIGNGISPTYFYYTVTDYKKEANNIFIEQVKLQTIPYFLEGPVRYFKMNIPYLKKKELYSKVKRSELYDSTLKMYKVNASIQEESMEIGRARAFTPGWLENESIWLHMEYKYLLELLKSELYEEFIEDFKNAVIPFLEEDVYGRSLLENSSFIASSANPNHEIHGKGFVARLSGSTVEFLDMWQIMMFGKTPFELYDGEILLNLTPTIPDYLIGNNKEIQATFLGDIKVIYILPDRKTILPTNTNIEKYEISYLDNDKEIITERISTKICNEIREKKVSTIKVTLKRIEF